MNDNQLIAEFMGWDIESPTTIPSNLHLSNLELDSGEVWAYEFHTSWDWLMPVVQKIDNMFGDDNQVDDAINRVHNAVLSFDIDNTYQAVVEFINEHNQNK
tara:strand:+ start:110 stop:412 length:303 start_codon:yes stop_codon:yes gene_type:complete